MKTTKKSILKLGEALLANPIANSNNAGKLLTHITKPEGNEELAKAAIRALQLFFADSLQAGELGKSTQGGKLIVDEAKKAHRQWLARKYAAYQAGLLDLLAKPITASLQISALTAVLELCRAGRVGEFQPSMFCQALELLFCSQHASAEVLQVLSVSFLQYSDIRYYVFRTVHTVASKAANGSKGLPHLLEDFQVAPEELARRVYAVLSQAKPLVKPAKVKKPGMSAEGDMEEEEAPCSWCEGLESGTAKPSTTSEGPKQRKKRKRLEVVYYIGWHEKSESVASRSDCMQEDSEGGPAIKGQDSFSAKWATPMLQKKAFGEAWLGFLRVEVPEDIFRKVLVKMHEDIIPHMPHPHALADLLTAALDRGGLTGMLALHAIYVLVTRHRLEYPAFYARLYQLLQPSTLRAKHRSRFFQLADVFLSSTLVPAYTMAAFAKRFSRLALTAPPAGALICLVFVHNILRRHQACLVLLDRTPPNGDDAPQSSGSDPYLESQRDPADSKAIESSLWEVQSLCSHYYTQVAVLAKQIMDKDLNDRKKTAELDIAPYVGGSYTGLLAAELNRRIKQVSTAFYPTPPTKLFDGNSALDFASWAF